MHKSNDWKIEGIRGMTVIAGNNKPLPNSWHLVKAKDVIDVRDGTHNSPQYQANGIALITSKNLVNGEIDFSTCGYISHKDHEEISKRSSVDDGDILFAMIGTIGNPVIVKKESEFSIKNVALFKFANSSVHNRYFLHILNSELIKQQFDKKSRGGTQKFISLGNIRELEIPLPPLPEQKRIAAILDAADALRSQRRQSIAELDLLLQSTFLEMFGDPVENPKGWEVQPLGELGTLDRGVSKHRPRNAPELLGGIHPLIQTGDVSNSNGYIKYYKSTYSDIGLKQSKIWKKGTLCITIAANIASTGILTFDACFPDSVVGFTSKIKGRVEYIQGLFWFFRKILDQQASQVAQKNINLKILRDFLVPVPPIELQEKFTGIVEAIEAQKAWLQAHLAELDTLFASLQQRAFNGEL